MKQSLAALVLLALLATTARAQTFTERLQQKVAGRGTVTLHHDAAIDALVNGAGSAPTTYKAKAGEAKAVESSRDADAKRRSEAREASTTTTVTPGAASDTRRKVIVGGTKVTGYRVQAYAGGNSRADRQKAEKVGNDIKLSFPEQPVYVHFYSPRWICRVGNYRTYEEAHQMLLQIRNMGYDKATIVKGKITVQD